MENQMRPELQQLLTQWSSEGVSIEDQLERLHVAVHKLAKKEAAKVPDVAVDVDDFDNMPV